MKSTRTIPTAAIAILAATTTPSGAVLLVEGTSTRSGGGDFHHELNVTNTGPEDFVIVSVSAPVSDPAIEPSLDGPAGFFTSYDPGLGIIDLVESTELFGAGTTWGGFTFNSASGPSALASFEALTDTGLLFTGTVSIKPAGAVPDNGGSLVMSSIALAAIAAARFRREPKQPAARRR